MQRVLIIGSPGAGKSTSFKVLARCTGLPLIHLDDLYWEKQQLGQQKFPVQFGSGTYKMR